MVAKARFYYGSAFKGSRGATQEDPLSPIIFNVVVDVVVQHWVTLMVESAEERIGRRQEGRHQISLLCVDDGIVALLDPRWLQGARSTLVGLFDRVVLKTKVSKTVKMLCRPCQAEGTQSEVAHGRRMTGAGLRTGRGSGFGYIARSAGRIWRLG